MGMSCTTFWREVLERQKKLEVADGSWVSLISKLHATAGPGVCRFSEFLVLALDAACVGGGIIGRIETSGREEKTES